MHSWGGPPGAADAPAGLLALDMVQVLICSNRGSRGTLADQGPLYSLCGFPPFGKLRRNWAISPVIRSPT